MCVTSNDCGLHLVDFQEEYKIPLLFQCRGSVSSPSGLLNGCVKQTKTKRVTQPLATQELCHGTAVQPPPWGWDLRADAAWLGVPRAHPQEAADPFTEPSRLGRRSSIYVFSKRKQNGVCLKFHGKLYFYELHVVVLMLSSLSENCTAVFNYMERLHAPA